MYKYTSQNAKIYQKLGIMDTTYEVSFNEVVRLIGNLKGKTVLDFGTGTGRSAKLLLTLGPKHVIGVDRDKNMINTAKKEENSRITYHLINREIPQANSSIDASLCAHVFPEINNLKEMQEILQEIYRVLRPGGVLVIVTTNPRSIGSEYKSYFYRKQRNLRSGDKIACVVKGDKSFEIQDVFWTIEDYKSVIESSGFTIHKISFPKAAGHGWLEETEVAPDVVFQCFKNKI